MSGGSRTPAVTVVALLPAHNEEASLPSALAALRRQTRRPDHIIVIAPQRVHPRFEFNHRIDQRSTPSGPIHLAHDPTTRKGMSPVPGSFSAERAIGGFGFKTVENLGGTFVGQFSNGARVAVNVGMVGSEMKATLPLLSKISAETLGNIEKGALNAAKGEGAISVTIKATMANDAMASILGKRGFTQVLDAAGKKTSDWVKTMKVE